MEARDPRASQTGSSSDPVDRPATGHKTVHVLTHFARDTPQTPPVSPKRTPPPVTSKYPLLLVCIFVEKTDRFSMVNTAFFSRGSASSPKKTGIRSRGYHFSRVCLGGGLPKRCEVKELRSLEVSTCTEPSQKPHEKGRRKLLLRLSCPYFNPISRMVSTTRPRQWGCKQLQLYNPIGSGLATHRVRFLKPKRTRKRAEPNEQPSEQAPRFSPWIRFLQKPASSAVGLCSTAFFNTRKKAAQIDKPHKRPHKRTQKGRKKAVKKPTRPRESKGLS